MINKTRFQAWVFDQLEPDQPKKRSGRKRRHIPVWTQKPPVREEKTVEEKEKMENEYLKKHGIDFK